MFRNSLTILFTHIKIPDSTCSQTCLPHHLIFHLALRLLLKHAHLIYSVFDMCRETQNILIWKINITNFGKLAYFALCNLIIFGFFHWFYPMWCDYLSMCFNLRVWYFIYFISLFGICSFHTAHRKKEVTTMNLPFRLKINSRTFCNKIRRMVQNHNNIFRQRLWAWYAIVSGGKLS